jgi:hypothetical protein
VLKTDDIVDVSGRTGCIVISQFLEHDFTLKSLIVRYEEFNP